MLIYKILVSCYLHRRVTVRLILLLECYALCSAMVAVVHARCPGLLIFIPNKQAGQLSAAGNVNCVSLYSPERIFLLSGKAMWSITGYWLNNYMFNQFI